MWKAFFICVMGCIFNGKGEILLAKRNDPVNPRFHGKWQMPGGAVEENETLEQALIREMKEETGLVVKLISQRPAVTFGEIDQEGKDLGLRLLLIAFPCKIISGKLGKNVCSETKELKWFKRNNIYKQKLLPGNRELIRQLWQEIEELIY